MTPKARRPRASTQRRLRGEQIALLAATAIAVFAIAWAGVRIAGRDDDEPRPGELAGDPGVSHAHGLGINPADGSLIVATHFGSFRLAADDDHAERIGESFQDTMGFTVIGPDRFLGSGHPDFAAMQEGQPGLLGLIESTDAGRTWDSVSLSGQVDFHALAFAHDHVYGWDSTSGRFMVSADRVEWEGRSTLQLYGFAVDPDDEGHVVAATPEGLSDSVDGGRTWQSVDGPDLVVVSWDRDAGLWGADADGTVSHEDEGGWSEAGQLPGTPQAFLVTGDEMYAAVHDRTDVTGIYRSTDGGAGWDLRFRDESQ